MSASFIPVGELGDGFAPGAHTLPTTDALAHRSFAFDIEHIPSLRIGEGTASWGEAQLVPVRITSIRAGIYLVDGVRELVSTSFVLDLNRGLVTVVEGTLPSEAESSESALSRIRRGEEPTAVTARFSHGHIDGSTTALHGRTEALVGLRNLYTYSPTEAYEHVYFTEQLYAWHCVRGVERDLADVDASHHIGIADRLTLFVWREKIVPTLGLILIDLEGMRTDGKIFGNTGFDATSLSNFPVGALAEILNVTRP